MPSDNRDLFAQVQQYLDNTTSIQWAVGIINSVRSLSAQVSINGSASVQACSFSNDMLLTTGDEVLLCRNNRTRQWVVVKVLGSSRSGSSVISRPKPNQAPGMPKWAGVNPQQSLGGSWSGTALHDVVAATCNFNGGAPMLIYNGYVTPGASDVQLDIGWGEGFDYQVKYSATIKTTVARTPVNIVSIREGQLMGSHTFNVRAQLGTGAITVVLTCNEFKIVEI